MSDLYRINREAISEWESDVLAGAAASGALAPVEPVGTLTVDKPAAGWSFATGDAVSGFTKLPPGKYLIVEAGDE